MKSSKEKIMEIIEIYSKLNSLGLNEEICLGVGEFKKIANEFIRTNINQQNLNGKIKLVEIDRELVYSLDIHPNIKSYAFLRYIGDDV